MGSAKQEQDIVVQIAKKFDGIDVNLPKLKKLVKTICNRFTRYEIRDTKYEISIAIVDEDEIRKVNNQFLNRNLATDCLSFDLSQEDKHYSKSFELVVNAERAIKEAHLRGHSSEAELALYVTHSLLHKLGFDDSTQVQAKKMHDAEDEILQQLGYGSVYNRSSG